MSYKMIESGSIQDIDKLVIIENGVVLTPRNQNKPDSLITKIKNKLFRRN